MIQKYKAYLKRLGLLTGIVYFIGVILFAFFISEYFYTPFVFLPVLFFVVTFAVHIALVKSFEHDMRKFASRFMMVFGVKILVLLILITTYVLIFPDQAVPFLITFLIQYLIFTAFETFYVVRLLKSSNRG